MFENMKLWLFRRKLQEGSLWQQVEDVMANQEVGHEYRYFLG